jgi:signal transduction histidine kinase
VQRAREVTGSHAAFAALPMGDDRLLVEVADGEGADELRGQLLRASATGLDEVIKSGVAASFQNPEQLSDSPGVAVPLSVPGDASRGVLVVLGMSGLHHTLAMRTLANFAGQAAVALELAERRRETERYAVFEDRDRIARDLHDLVIQRLFATGMQLEGASRLISDRPEEAQRRVLAAVDDLDATIRELRSTIYSLQAPADQMPSLRARILQVVDAGTEQLGYAPSLRMEGLLDTVVPPSVAEHMLAALREALSNAARHAEAKSVDVLIAVKDEQVAIEVADDGIGLGTSGRRSGLANLTVRAEQLGGELTVRSQPGDGTTLLWRVQLPRGS